MLDSKSEEIQQIDGILDVLSEPFVVLDSNLKVFYANGAAKSRFVSADNELDHMLSQISPFVLDTVNKFRKTSSFKTSLRMDTDRIFNTTLVISPIFLGVKLYKVVIMFFSSSLVTSVNLPREGGSLDRKRTFKQIRAIVLDSLLDKRKTINQIANDTGVNWKTVEKHLTYLIGRAYVEEVFSSEYIRIFELTEKGKRIIKAMKDEQLSKVIKQIEG